MRCRAPLNSSLCLKGEIMAYIIKARFYAGPDQTGESYVITSDNNLPDTKLEVGRSMKLVMAQQKNAAVKCELSKAMKNYYNQNPGLKPRRCRLCR